MEQYINAVLVKIDENRVVVIEGEEYLLLNQKQPPTSQPVEKTKKKAARPYTKLAEVRKAIIGILINEDELSANDLQFKLKAKYGLTPPKSSLSTLLGKMRDESVLKKIGERNNAVWSLKEKPIPPPPPAPERHDVV